MTVTVRPATPDDSRRLFDWRNDPVTRAMSLTTDPVPWEVHTLWFATVMNSRNRPIFIGERDGVAIGMVRFDISGDLAEISVALAPEARGQRLATPLLRAAIAALHAQRPVAILAEVRPENTGQPPRLPGRRVPRGTAGGRHPALSPVRAQGTGPDLNARLPAHDFSLQSARRCTAPGGAARGAVRTP